VSPPPLPEIFGNYALGDFVELVPPESISWWPQTTGWLWLGTVLLALGLRQSWIKLRHWYRNRYRREAAVQLQELRNNGNRDCLAPELNRLLKLVALVAYSRETVAKLSGPAWTDFLNLQCETAAFNDDQLQLLATASYRQRDIDEASAQGLMDAGLRWIRDHRGADNA
jgi:hypothetical protein